MKTTARHLAAVVSTTVLTLAVSACSATGGTTTPTMSSSAPLTTSSAATSSTSGSVGSTSVASEILLKAKNNALSAKSGAFSGHVDQNGKTMVIDYKGTADGTSADVSLQVESEGKVHVISVPSGVYIQADTTFWKAQGAPASVQKAGNRFVKVPSGTSNLASSLSLNTFLDKAFGAVSASALSDTVGSQTVNGIDTWVLTDKKGPDEGALYVSKGTYEVVRFVASKDKPGQLDFSRWNEDLGITAPPADQVMSLG